MAFIQDIKEPELIKINNSLVELEPLNVDYSLHGFKVIGSTFTQKKSEAVLFIRTFLEIISELNKVNIGINFSRTIGGKQSLITTDKVKVFIDSLGYLCCCVSSDDSKEFKSVTPIFTQKRNYFVDLQIEDNKTIISYSTDGDSFTKVIDEESDVLIEDTILSITMAGESVIGTQYFIDKCYVKANDKVAWKGGRNILRINPGFTFMKCNGEKITTHAYMEFPIHTVFDYGYSSGHDTMVIYISESFDDIEYDYPITNDALDYGMCYDSDNDTNRRYINGKPLDDYTFFEPICSVEVSNIHQPLKILNVSNQGDNND